MVAGGLGFGFWGGFSVGRWVASVDGWAGICAECRAEPCVYAKSI